MLPDPEEWLNRVQPRQQGQKLTLINPPELHLAPNQKSCQLNHFAGIQAADYPFTYKE
tara:strand:+ start:1305 stop:1478 length:174 start_codon:yes stop_codon:yes gene_type:complete